MDPQNSDLYGSVGPLGGCTHQVVGLLDTSGASGQCIFVVSVKPTFLFVCTKYYCSDFPVPVARLLYGYPLVLAMAAAKEIAEPVHFVVNG